MDEPIVLIVGDFEGDPGLRVALDHLVALSAKGLLRRFWFVDSSTAPSESVATTRVDHGRAATDALFRSMASIRRPSTTRVLSALSALASPTAIARSTRFAEGLQRAVERLQPPGVPLKRIRIVFPDSLSVESELALFLDSHADANLIAIPEDRASDLGFAAPVTTADMQAFGAHIAAEMATQGGLWSSMSDAPVDRSVAGVIDGNDIPVRFVRSYARAAIGPPLPLYEAMTAGDTLPVPPGPPGRTNSLQSSPNQWASARDFADHLHSDITTLSFAPPPPFDAGRWRPTTRRAAARLYFQQARNYLRELPTTLTHSLRDDAAEFGGELLLSAVGDQSRLEVDWVGKDSGLADSESLASKIALLTEGLECRMRAYDLESVESTPIDQAVWGRLVHDVTGAVDAGDGTTTKLRAGDTILVINDPKVIGPDPTGGLESALQSLNSEPLSPSNGTLLGRLAGRIRGEIDEASAQFVASQSALAQAIEDAEPGRIRALPYLAWSLGGVLTVALTALILGFGVAEAVGIDTWSEGTRYFIGLVIAILWLGAAALCLLSAQRMIKSKSKWIPWIACGGILGASGLVWAVLSLFMGWWTLASTPIQELGIILGVIACLAISTVFAFIARNRGHRTMAKLIGILLMSYVSIALIGTLVRLNGWFLAFGSSTIRSVCLKITIMSLAVSLGLFVAIVFFRVRERLALYSALDRIKHSADSARLVAADIVRLHAIYQQFLGTALALNRVLQLPFGARPANEYEGPGHQERFGAYKVSLHYFELEGKARKGALARIRRLVAERGWMFRQYMEGAKAFVPEFAFQTGRDPDEIEGISPESDQTVGRVTPNHMIPGSGPRWRFAEILYEGGFDNDLERAGVNAALSDALTKYLTPSTDTDDDEGIHLGVLEHGRELVSGDRPPLASEVFAHLDLLTAGDVRAVLDSTVWWPVELEEPEQLQERTTIRSTSVDRSDPTRLVIEFIRSDWSMQFPLSRIPLGTGCEPAGSEDHAAKTSDLVEM